LAAVSLSEVKTSLIFLQVQKFMFATLMPAINWISVAQNTVQSSFAGWVPDFTLFSCGLSGNLSSAAATWDVEFDFRQILS
jgi:hypothetical protein